MNIVMLGPQGSGKGTQSQKMSELLDIPHISTGDIFRENIKNETELGKKVKAIIDGGNLVSDELTNEIVKDRLEKEDCKEGYILDGYPRNTAQAKALESFATVTLAIEITLEDEEAIARIGGRRTHKETGIVYHTIYNPAPENIPEEELIQRDDDKPDAIKLRLKTYHEETEPITAFYKEKGILSVIDGKLPIPEVFENIKKILEEKKKE